MKQERAGLYSYKGRPGGNNHEGDKYTFLSRTSKVLCYNCNTHRLGRTMQDATSILLQLATGKISLLSKLERIALLKYFRRMGYLVDILTSNYQLTEEQRRRREHAENAYYRRNPPVYDARQRYLWLREAMHPADSERWPMPLDGVPSSSSPGPDHGQPRVYIGRHRGYLGADFPVDNSKHFTPEHDDMGKRFYYVIGELAVAIIWGLPLGDETIPPTHLIPDSYLELLADDEVIAWPPLKPVTYYDFFMLHNPPVEGQLDYYALANAMQQPRQRAEIINAMEIQLGLVAGSTCDELLPERAR